MKPLVVTTLSLLLLLSACGGTPPKEETPPASSTSTVQVSGLTQPIAHTPAIITSAGQSADASMLSAILERAGFVCDLETNLLADHFDTSHYQTLIVGVGGSQKGLGAAGVDAKVEQERVDAVLAKAKESNLPVIVAHIGGDARRGELSDQFIRAVSPQADYLVVVESGDHDGIFTQIAGENGIPMDKVEALADVGEVMMQAFS